MRDFARGMRDGAAVALVGLVLGALKAFFHALKYPTPAPNPAVVLQVFAFVIGGFALGGGIVRVARKKMDVRFRRD